MLLFIIPLLFLIYAETKPSKAKEENKGSRLFYLTASYSLFLIPFITYLVLDNDISELIHIRYGLLGLSLSGYIFGQAIFTDLKTQKINKNVLNAISYFVLLLVLFYTVNEGIHAMAVRLAFAVGLYILITCIWVFGSESSIGASDLRLMYGMLPFCAFFFPESTSFAVFVGLAISIAHLFIDGLIFKRIPLAKIHTHKIPIGQDLALGYMIFFALVIFAT